MYSLILLLHILGATIWTGGHIVLSCVVLPQSIREKSPAKLMSFESGFEKLGIPALVIQVLTGFWLAYNLLPEPAGWFSAGNVVSRLILIKLILLVLTVIFALDARLRLIPKLRQGHPVTLAYHIILVTVVSVLLVAIGVAFRTGAYF
jgi:putative copper export protein